jgi:serine/threonine-protein kinase
MPETEGQDNLALPSLGSMFGRYRLDSILGRGGMGVVFRATDTQLERDVALKFLAPELAGDAEFRQRFERESKLAAAIDHPGIVPIFEAETTGDVPFIAMRFVPGQDLGAILRHEAPLSQDRTLALLSQVADALDAAHRRGLIHRDVKPANILVHTEGDEERAHLADFGLSRRASEGAVWTRAGPLGTVDYVAPELVEGGLVDGRADQYSLACVTFECLAGRPPFRAETEAAMLFVHVSQEPPLLSSVLPRGPAALDQVLVRALSKGPDARYASCGRAFRGSPRRGHIGGGSAADRIPAAERASCSADRRPA